MNQQSKEDEEQTRETAEPLIELRLTREQTLNLMTIIDGALRAYGLNAGQFPLAAKAAELTQLIDAAAAATSDGQ